MEFGSQRLILFDVDQTLVSLPGGSAKAFSSAFEEVHGIPNAFLGMTFAGGLDLPLMNEMYRKWNLAPNDSTAMPDVKGGAMKDHRGGDKLYHLAHC